MALISPHPDPNGALAIGERAPIGQLRVETSVDGGIAGRAAGNDLVAGADGPLGTARGEGKRRTIRATPQATNAVGAE
ncbi:MAG: hypothetical protein ACTHQQ_13745 [Solirubrobacteraceae bacterium]